LGKLEWSNHIYTTIGLRMIKRQARN